jgi:hypothetical protein
MKKSFSLLAAATMCAATIPMVAVAAGFSRPSVTEHTSRRLLRDETRGMRAANAIRKNYLRPTSFVTDKKPKMSSSASSSSSSSSSMSSSESSSMSSSSSSSN